MAALSDPNRHDLEYVRKYLRRCAARDPRSVIHGLDSRIWTDSDHEGADTRDLMVLRPRSTNDPFSKWVAEHLIRWVIEVMWPSRGSQLEVKIDIDNARILQATSVITVIVAVLLVVGSIVVLYNTNTMKVRLILIAVFAVVTSVCIMVFTPAKKSEVLAITAA